MLTESPIQSVARDLDRRWMSDDYFDLIVWYAPDGALHGFQLCYDTSGRERAFTWTPDRGFAHAGIDTGESEPDANRTPILIASSIFPVDEVRAQFLARSIHLPAEIRDIVLQKIAEYKAVCLGRSGSI